MKKIINTFNEAAYLALLVACIGLYILWLVPVSIITGVLVLVTKIISFCQRGK